MPRKKGPDYVPRRKGIDLEKQRASERRRREKHKAAGRCQCGRERVPGKKLCEPCATSRRLKTRERYAARRAAGLCATCGSQSEAVVGVRCARCAAYNVKHRKNIKAEVFKAFGGKCECCGVRTLAFLTIDHINNDGHKHRKAAVGKVGGGSPFFYWLKKNGFPKDGLRLLCFNCNLGRQVNGGVCPHEKRLRQKKTKAEQATVQPVLFQV